MTRVPAWWGAIFVNPEKCPVASGRFCWHDRKRVCSHYHGTAKQVFEPYSGPVTVLCSAPTGKGKKTT